MKRAFCIHMEASQHKELKKLVKKLKTKYPEQSKVIGMSGLIREGIEYILQKEEHSCLVKQNPKENQSL